MKLPPQCEQRGPCKRRFARLGYEATPTTRLPRAHYNAGQR